MSFVTKDCLVAAESIGQLEKELKAAKEAQRYAESQHEAGYRVLALSHEDKNKLKAENQRQAKEVERLKSQLAQTLEENQRLKGGIFGK